MAKRAAKGDRYNARKVMSRERRAFGMMMVDQGDAAASCPDQRDLPRHHSARLQIIGFARGARAAAWTCC